MAAPETSALRTVYDERSFYIARVTLSEFVVAQADQTTHRIGFSYEPVADAPSTFPALQKAYAHSQTTGEPLPVSAEHSETVVYGSAEVNYALRYWHDVGHIEQGLTFALVDELELALFQLDVLQREGFGPETLVWKLLHADLVGSVYSSGLVGRFPDDQRRFADHVVAHGFDRGLLEELLIGRQREQAQ